MAYQPKSYRKFVATAATATLVATAVTPAFAAGFTDVPANYKEAVDYLVKNDVTGGLTETQFGTQEQIKRVDAAVMLAKLLKLDTENAADAGFTDVPKRAQGAVNALKAKGIINGKTETKFGSEDTLTRGEMAIIIARAYELTDKAEVKFTDVSDRYADSVAKLVAAGITQGKTATQFGTADPIKRGEFAIFAFRAENPAPVVEAKVESVSAINASELKVTFTQPVDKVSAEKTENYQLKINNNEIKDIQDINVSEDGKSAILLLDQQQVAFQNGDKYVIQTNDDIKAKNGKKLAKFVSNEITFSETAAPVLVSVDKKGTNLELTFDRPVNSYKAAGKDMTLVKVDGLALAATDLKPVDAVNTEYLAEAGKYKYTVALTADEEKVAKTKGNHEVVIFDVADTAKEYAKVASVVSGTYTITDAVTTPEVIGVEAVNANRFFLYTNTTVELNQNSKVTVNKGSHEFAMDLGTKYDNHVNTDDTVVDAFASTYKNKPGIWVTVTDDAAGNDENPLYRSGEAAVNLSVTVENFTADGLIGKKSTKSVTLEKSNTKPVVEKTEVVDKKLVVEFTNELVNLDGTDLTAIASENFVVRDNEGIIIEDLTASVSGDTVVISGSKFEAKDAPYTVDFKAGKFKNKEERNVVAKYLVNTAKNDAISVKVGKKDNANFEYTEYKFDTTPSTGNTTVDTANNTITFKYDVKMDDSARNIANYTLDGKSLPVGAKVDFVGDRQTVRVTFPEGTFKNSTKYKFGITTNVKTQAGSKIVGSLQTKAPAELVFDVQDNVKPELASAVYYVGTEDVQNNTTTTKLELTFNEAVNLSDASKAANDFDVKVNGSEVKVDSVASATTGTNKERKIVLTLAQDVNVSQAATISVIAEEFQKGTDKVIAVVDGEGNKAKEGTTTSATKYKYDAGYAAELDAQADEKALADAKAAAKTKIETAETAVATSKQAADTKVDAAEKAKADALAADPGADTTALDQAIADAKDVQTKVAAEVQKVADAKIAYAIATTVADVNAEVQKAEAAVTAAADLVK